MVEEIYTSGDTGPAAYIAHHAKNVELFLDDYAAANINGEEIPDWSVSRLIVVSSEISI